MDELTYPLSLGLIVVLAFIFYRNNSLLLLVLVLGLGGYIIYSHETGYTTTDFRDEFVESIDESIKSYEKSHGIDSIEEEKIGESIDFKDESVDPIEETIKSYEESHDIDSLESESISESLEEDGLDLDQPK